MNSYTKKYYSLWFLLPGGIIFFTFFLLPTFSSFFFSMTWWTLRDWKFIGLENFRDFFRDPNLNVAIPRTLIYAGTTSISKVVLGLVLGACLASTKVRSRNYLRSMLFFPHLLSTLAIGLVFQSMMHPTRGIINSALALIGIKGPDWLGNPTLAIYSVAMADVWKGVGIATVIYVAGILSISPEYYEALEVDGGGAMHKFFYITLPLCRPAMNSVIILSLIGGLRSFDLIMSMTSGGPGFATHVMSYIIYKLYANSLYGLSTAANVIMLLFISAISFPVYLLITRKEVDL